MSVVSNPEFLREGAAVGTSWNPRCWWSADRRPRRWNRSPRSTQACRWKPSIVALRTAELIKYACNAFHAVKIAFANEIGALAGTGHRRRGGDGDPVPRRFAEYLARLPETRLRIRRLLPAQRSARPGVPGVSAGSETPLLESVLPANIAQLDRAIQLVLDLPADRIGVFGLAFKENTDDLRESPVVQLLETLIGKGRKVRVHDPHIQLGEIYGSNQRYIMNAIPHIGNLLDDRLEAMLAWADHVLVAQKPSPGDSSAPGGQRETARWTWSAPCDRTPAPTPIPA